ncbi:anaerobic ribonucleoside-triphosphate reductase activating protein [Methanocella conradii]|uniref:anaerobic ribonucleoside-triphosphate reductase activating protein n=1 Tax=Methanocella conradii TaxID=1175444 RepID=UPI0024B3BBF6|nr:anaerobic ribonucleoside-triphosphate reductase activating protein [Methanocella conradii]MDI6897395.1 anaerobic ribonucleoside-triphosphate reductase activating protein [Methanocella conradii]
MRLNLGDIVPISTLDWPGKVVLVVFTRGCPLRCPYCSNGRFIEAPEDGEGTDVEQVRARILDAADFIDGVVFSGGEPFMQPMALKELASYAKGIGLPVGVHTNGAYPDRIGSMADDGLLDSVFLDVKAPLEYELYRAACGADLTTFEAIKRSVALCCGLRKGQKIRYLEARTTVFRGIGDKPSDIEKIARAIEFADAYVVQQGRPEVAMDEKIKALDAVPRIELLSLAAAARKASKGIGSIKVRTHIFGDEVVE